MRGRVGPGPAAARGRRARARARARMRAGWPGEVRRGDAPGGVRGDAVGERERLAACAGGDGRRREIEKAGERHGFPDTGVGVDKDGICAAHVEDGAADGDRAVVPLNHDPVVQFVGLPEEATVYSGLGVRGCRVLHGTVNGQAVPREPRGKGVQHLPATNAFTALVRVKDLQDN
jgi:hypothetical protein